VILSYCTVGIFVSLFASTVFVCVKHFFCRETNYCCWIGVSMFRCLC